MIEKNRLQELIEQGATIYEVKYGKVNQVSLKNKIRFVSEKYPVIVFEPRPNEKYKHHKYFDKLYETQEEAEWVAKMHTEHTEHFNPPLFENLPYEYSFKFIRNGIEHELFCKRDSYIVVISCCKDYMSGTDDMEYNEENYTKAVEYARKLFKGEEI